MLLLSHAVCRQHDARCNTGGKPALDLNGGGPKGPPSAPPTIPPIIINPFRYRLPDPAIDPRVRPDPPPVQPPHCPPIRLSRQRLW